MPRYPVLMLLVFALTLFTSATLLFLVEPMIGKMITPLLGGTPAVWNTAMVFFQAVLLLGYLYAHLSTTWLGARKQAVLHLALLAVPFVSLPLAVNRDLVKGDENPVFLVLLLLSLTVGLPMFVVSASAPLLQKWFASTSHPAAKDPYFLYGASNLGSMLALAAYPVVVERFLGLRQQSVDWTVGYGMLVALTALCAVFLWLSPRNVEKTFDAPADEDAIGHTLGGSVTWLRVLRWVALAIAPSSLMLGVTTYMTTDIAAIAFLWVVPLALYLLSFIIVFSRAPAWVHKGMVLLMPLVVLTILFFKLTGLSIEVGLHPITWSIILHLTMLFVVAMVCHGELARDRPAPKYLTGYFLWISVGGVLGGLFNALVAPMIFNDIVEYELAILLACFLLPPLGEIKESVVGRRVDVVLASLLGGIGLLLIVLRLFDRDLPFQVLKDRPWPWLLAVLCLGVFVGVVAARRARRQKLDHWLDLVLPLCLGVLLVGLTWGLRADIVWPRVRQLADLLHRDPYNFLVILIYGVPLVLCYTFVERPLRFAAGIGALLLANAFCDLFDRSILYQTRSFFGVLMVKEREEEFRDESFLCRTLFHGTTLHGMQFRDEDRRDQPPTYYHPSGPLGQLMLTFNRLNRESGRLPNLAVIGLGTGTMACYAQPGQHLTFYDIDPVVRRLSFDEDNPYFTFVNGARRRGAQVDLVMGDARLTMEKKQLEDSDKYGILIVDAFSSDAIPVHLLTREALQIYLSKTTEDALLCFHISNRHLDLEPVLYNLAKACGLSAVYMSDEREIDPHSTALLGKTSSTWVVLARKSEYLDGLRDLNNWEDEREDLQRMLLPLALLPDNGTGLATQASWIHNLLGEEVCKRPSKWKELEPNGNWPNPDKVGVWTDDYSNLLSVFRW